MPHDYEILGAMLGFDDADDDEELEFEDVLGEEDEDVEEMEDLYLMGQARRGRGYLRALRPRRRGRRTPRAPRSFREARGRAIARRGARVQEFKSLKRQLVPDVPGIAGVGLRGQPLGFTPVLIFTDVSGTTLTATGAPQKPFKGSRLLIAIARTGPTATGLITLDRLDMGTQFQQVNVAPLPADGFAAGAFQIELNLDPITPGVVATIQLSTTLAPTAPDTIAVSSMIIGATM